MLFKTQVLDMLYSSYKDSIDPNDIEYNKDLVRECPKGSGYDYGIHIGKLLGRYGMPKEIDTTSCNKNRVKCDAVIQGSYFNVCYDPNAVFQYVCGDRKIPLYSQYI